jgi:hypothetical protein
MAEGDEDFEDNTKIAKFAAWRRVQPSRPSCDRSDKYGRTECVPGTEIAKLPTDQLNELMVEQFPRTIAFVQGVHNDIQAARTPIPPTVVGLVRERIEAVRTWWCLNFHCTSVIY